MNSYKKQKCTISTFDTSTLVKIYLTFIKKGSLYSRPPEEITIFQNPLASAYPNIISKVTKPSQIQRDAKI